MRYALKAVLFAATSLTSLPAAAQEESEIVVTATRTPTKADRLPVRVDVIDRYEIEASGLVSLADAIGPQAVQSGGAGQQTSTFLRGANSKHALALFDGVRLNDAANPNASYDFGQDTLGALERVEVLRGPASTIYGSDAIGGVVNVIPRRGGETAFEPFFELMGGSFDTRRVLLGAAGDASDLEYGVSAEMFDTEGFDHVPERIVTHTGDEDGASIDTFTASIRGDAGAFAFDALFRARESEAEYDTFSGGAFFDLRADDPDLGNEASQRLWRLGAEMEASAGLTFRLSGGEVTSDRSETDGGFQTSAADSERTFADLTAAYEHERVALTGGLSFEHNAIDTQPLFANPLSVEEDQAAAYVIGQFEVTDAITATGSVRVDDYENFGAHTTYALGAVANFEPFRVFGSYATSFKAPSLSERFEQSFFNIGNPNLEPEEAESWEVGADWDVTSAVRLGASYYQTRIEDLIEYRFALLQNVNIGEAATDGAEAYAEARPTSWSWLRLSYAWTDARDEAFDTQLLRRPEDAWQIDARITPTERFSLAFSWAYVGDRTDVIYNDDGTFSFTETTTDGFNVGALSATYDLTEHAQLFARVDNVTDETYEQPNAYAGAPRSFYLGARARF